VTALHGDHPSGLQGVTVRDRISGEAWIIPVRQLFLFIGAEPNTAWLDGCLKLDEKGYIVTGALADEEHDSFALPLQTSLPRVFAIGDVRSGSTKRVASAVGEGAAVVAQIHVLLGAALTTA
jgi:thioredoxin reductase (NADPH)